MLGVVKRSQIFDEFTPDEQEFYFSIKEKAVAHHVDTLYYSVYIKGDEVQVRDERIMSFLEALHEAKQNKLMCASEEVNFLGFSVSAFGAAISAGMYMNRLSYGEDFDVFVSDYIPNLQTPRIQVQLRTRSLVLDGLYGSIQKSFDMVEDLLLTFGLEIGEIVENRIDYAFHTNAIQKPMEMFSDENLAKHLITSFREVCKHAWITNQKDEFFDLDYIALGSRKSNNVFFRAYAKAKEVVQMNYKGFFFEKWRARGLISRYDQFVYEKAYELKSFKTGCLVGRIEWYLRYGKYEELKEKLSKLLKSCHVNSDNNPHIEKEIKGILPPPTVVLNLEFETKRKFYTKLDDFISCYEYVHKSDLALKRLHKVLSLRREILDKLFTDVVRFVENRYDPKSEELDFWKRIRRVKIEDQPDKPLLDAWYSYSRNLDVRRAQRSFSANLASLAMINRNEASESTFPDDIWEAFTLLNDNNTIELSESRSKVLNRIFKKITPPSYSAIQKKKSRQLKPVLKKDVKE